MGKREATVVLALALAPGMGIVTRTYKEANIVPRYIMVLVALTIFVVLVLSTKMDRVHHWGIVFMTIPLN